VTTTRTTGTMDASKSHRTLAIDRDATAAIHRHATAAIHRHR
jgi:hypothetical protein